MIDYSLILTRRYPESRWRLDGDEYEGLEWLSDDPKPTKKTLEKLWPEVKKELQIERAKMDRATAYREEADPLFFQVQRGEVEQSEYDAKIEEIKQRFPYPE